MALAFVAGVASALAYYKHSAWAAGTILLVLPVAVLGLLGWPHDSDFRDTSLISMLFWVVFGFAGLAVGTASVTLRMIK